MSSPEPAGADKNPGGDGGSLRERILTIISEQGVIERERLTGEATLEELGVQSIDIVMILNELEDVFGIYIPVDQSVADVRNIDDLVTLVSTLIENREADSPGAGAAPGTSA